MTIWSLVTWELCKSFFIGAIQLFQDSRPIIVERLGKMFGNELHWAYCCSCDAVNYSIIKESSAQLETTYKGT